MTLDEAERAIVREWSDWAKEHSAPNGRDAFIFFGYLQSSRPDLLSFRCSGDKWQRVHGWLLRRGLVND